MFYLRLRKNHTAVSVLSLIVTYVERVNGLINTFINFEKARDLLGYFLSVTRDLYSFYVHIRICTCCAILFNIKQEKGRWKSKDVQEAPGPLNNKLEVYAVAIKIVTGSWELIMDKESRDKPLMERSSCSTTLVRNKHIDKLMLLRNGNCVEFNRDISTNTIS
ncbi:uncharacterized protein LOC116163237 isoform X1 [Photinus pyralis]|uniref:uncharacterized protein LOC116163237 isoform X1 n=1 Tax=Photinus pyralis TaxID=7054 RepID=UPI00126775C9|nr:uncharacterized protein LOC116163237 isoform X1 [Photinus pyralis]